VPGTGRSSWRCGRNCRPTGGRATASSGSSSTAQAQAGYLSWLRLLTLRTELERVTSDKRHQEEARWGPPRQSDADAIDQAAAMMERYNRIFLRTLRALCDMRRHGSPVIVQNGGQMNVAQQQVNVAAGVVAPPAK
jgi:hypothetical protein